MNDLVEFYDGKRMIAAARSSIVPPVGAKISIRKELWIVLRVTYALDHADGIQERCIRANVDVVRSS